MKKLLDLGTRFVVKWKCFSKDLTGTKLLCVKYIKNIAEISSTYITAIIFLSENSAKIYSINTPTYWKVFTENTSYEVKPNKIKIGSSSANSINRETLTYGISDHKCEIQSSSWEPSIEMEKILDELIKKQESKNKL